MATAIHVPVAIASAACATSCPKCQTGPSWRTTLSMSQRWTSASASPLAWPAAPSGCSAAANWTYSSRSLAAQPTARAKPPRRLPDRIVGFRNQSQPLTLKDYGNRCSGGKIAAMRCIPIWDEAKGGARERRARRCRMRQRAESHGLSGTEHTCMPRFRGGPTPTTATLALSNPKPKHPFHPRHLIKKPWACHFNIKVIP